jgi:hypothetical protein
MRKGMKHAAIVAAAMAITASAGALAISGTPVSASQTVASAPCRFTIHIAVARDGSEDDPVVTGTCHGHKITQRQIRLAGNAILGLPQATHVFPTRVHGHRGAIVCVADCDTSARIWSVDGHGEAQTS